MKNEHIKSLMRKAGYAAPEMAGRAITLVDLVVDDLINIINNTQPFPEETIKEIVDKYYPS